MEIKFKYEKSQRYTDESIEVSANDAPIGILKAYDNNELMWSPDDRIYNIKFQFRNEETFLKVTQELQRYKDEQGYKYLTIWSYNNGYAEVLDKELLEKAGFRHIPGKHPACMCLE